MNLRTVIRKFWLFGPITGFACALLATTLFTTLDWIRNYGGIFRNASGTDWDIVYETVASWFVPTLIYVTILASLGHLLVSGILFIYRKYFSRNNNASIK